MNRLPLAKRAQLIGMLVEGNNLSAVSRMADVSINTVMAVLVETGSACSEYQSSVFRNLTCKRLQCDEIWAFVSAKAKSVPANLKESDEADDVWTWTAIDADTKLVPCWMMGGRDAQHARLFMDELASRVSSCVQLTTDGHKAYLSAVPGAFGHDIDYALLVKQYGTVPDTTSALRYSSGHVTGLIDQPKEAYVSTSHVERENLTIRMGMRHPTQLTNGFSKKIENYVHAVSLHFMYYNFGCVHKVLQVTPAMEAGITNHVWSLAEIVALVPERTAKKRGPYKKQTSENLN